MYNRDGECLLRGTDWVFKYNSTFCPPSVFMCFVWIWEQTAIISLYSINRLVFITETESVYCAVRSRYICMCVCLYIYIYIYIHRFIRNNCRGFNNLSYTIHLRQEYTYFFYLIEPLQVFVTYLTGALYVHPLWFYKHQHDNRVRSELSVACQRWWFQWRFWFVPSIPGYLRQDEEHVVLLN